MRATQQSPLSERGSIYVLTLITVAAISAIILIGFSLRSSENESLTLSEEVVGNTTGSDDGVSYTLQWIQEHSEWQATAKTGKLYSSFSLGDRTYSNSIIDIDTGAAPTDSTTNYRVTAKSVQGAAARSASVDLTIAKDDYAALLKNSYGAKHYWALNEPSKSATALDGIDKYDGTYLDPLIAGSGTNDEGGVVPVFAGSSDEIEVPHGKDFKNSKGAISLWVKNTDTNRLNFHGILGKHYDNKGSLPTLSVAVWNDAILAYISDDGGFYFGQFALSSGSTFSANQWHHVLINFGDSGLQIFVDGTRTANNSGCTTGLGTAEESKGGWQPLLIGAGFDVTPMGSTQRGFVGSIAHVAWLGSPLSADDVAALASVKPDLSQVQYVDGSWTRVFE